MLNQMIIPDPIEVKKPVKSGIVLYRGFSNQEILKRYLDKGISPKVPLNINTNSPSEIIKLLYGDQAPQKHICPRQLERKTGHFVSFSLRKSVACYYATSDDIGDYKKPGYIAVVRFPNILEPIAIAGNLRRPYIFKCAIGTEWLDLRSLLTLDMKNIRTYSRTQVDHELLLMRGTIRPKIISVRPEDCDRSFLPWKDWGERIKIRS